jgi:curved DNA-binding protein CbpA
MPPRVPRKVQGVNVYALPLTTLEGFVFSLVDGAVSVDDISMMSGVDQTKLPAILERLSELGALDLPWIEKPKPSAAARKPSKPADAHFTAARPRYSTAELNEEVALTIETRKRILDAFYALEGRNHYELLGVARDADKKVIRNSYFELSKVFHPDAHFGKQLGAFKSKMENVFKRLTEAYEVLGKAKKRADYDEYLATTEQTSRVRQTLEFTAEEIEKQREHREQQLREEEEQANAQSRPQAPLRGDSRGASVNTRDALRPPRVPSVDRMPAVSVRPQQSAAERRARVRDRLRQRLKGSSVMPPPPAATPAPMVDDAQRRRSLIEGLRTSIRASAVLSSSSNAQVLSHLQKAKDAEQAGDALLAASQLQLALAIEPSDPRLLSEYDRVSKVVARNLADNYEKQAQYEEKTGNWQSAAKSWMRVSDGRPEDQSAARRAAEAMLKASLDLHRAQKYAQKAVNLDGRNVENLTVLARVYLAAGLKLNALRELERAAQLAPADEMVNNLLRAAR